MFILSLTELLIVRIALAKLKISKALPNRDLAENTRIDLLSRVEKKIKEIKDL